MQAQAVAVFKLGQGDGGFALHGGSAKVRPATPKSSPYAGAHRRAADTPRGTAAPMAMAAPKTLVTLAARMASFAAVATPAYSTKAALGDNDAASFFQIE